jgi:hypothetical protein
MQSGKERESSSFILPREEEAWICPILSKCWEGSSKGDVRIIKYHEDLLEVQKFWENYERGSLRIHPL